jgi:hypothetical protein
VAGGEGVKDRHQCEVRYVLALRVKGNSLASQYLEQVEKKRGAAAVGAIKRDAREQWDLGNRGNADDWRGKDSKLAA